MSTMKKNHFITLEGGEGVGKSTAMNFIKQYFLEKKMDCLFTREPGGTPVAEKIRDLLLKNSEEKVEPIAELLLMFAARAQHISNVIKPALSSGKTVISDRFTDASFAYQGGGRQIPIDKIQILTEWVQANLEPDLTLLLDANVEMGLSRIESRGKKDRIEQEALDFFNRVKSAYAVRAKQFPKRFVVIDANQSLESVQAQIKNALQKLIPLG